MKHPHADRFHELLAIFAKFAHVRRQLPAHIQAKMELPLKIQVDDSMSITEDEVQAKIRRWNSGIGATSCTILPREEKRRRVVALLDRHVDLVQSADRLTNGFLDFALLSFLTHTGIMTEFSAAIADALYDDDWFETQPLSGDMSMLIDFCHYVYHELEQDPSEFIYKYRT